MFYRSQNYFSRNSLENGHLEIGETGVLCKLNLEKAYDHVCWGLSRYMLRRCGFGGRMLLSCMMLVLLGALSLIFRWGLGMLLLHISHLLFTKDTLIVCGVVLHTTFDT